MKYAQIIAAVNNSPWAIQEEKLREIRAFLALKAAGGDIDPAEIQAIASARRPMDVQMSGRTAIVPVFGSIAQRLGMLGNASGGVSCEALAATIGSLVEDKQVKTICLAFDSPGGSVYGVQELAAKLRGWSARKNVVAISDSVCASAAYWLASQAREIWCTPGGMVGSVGVLIAHTDYSRAEEEAGVKTTIVAAGEHKAEFSDVAPLTDDARAELQKQCNSYYAAFVEDIAKGRGTTPGAVKADYGKGRTMNARDAKAAGMIDRVGTLDDLFAKYSDGVPGARVTAQMAAVRARALEVSQ